MQEIVPNYYHKFQCIADRCNHNCCIGWEIEIDEDTLEYYRTMNTSLGERLRRSIEGDPAHFILVPGDRCPFLNEKGLCDIICEQGEDALCDICTLHPRFRNFFGSFTETGLGLCCEEAARIILTEEEPFSIPYPTGVELSNEEEIFLARRQKLFEVLWEREKTVQERFSHLGEMLGFSFDFSLEELRKTYLSLERLDESWTRVLEKLEGFAFEGRIFSMAEFQKPLEQLAVYFIFRHLTDALWDGKYVARVRFALMSCYLMGAIWEKCWQDKEEIPWETLIELARMYSAEIEYSEENTARLLNME